MKLAIKIFQSRSEAKVTKVQNNNQIHKQTLYE